MLPSSSDGCASRADSYHAPVMASTATPGSTSIEQLKRRPGVRLVPSPKIEMITIPDFIPRALCEELMGLIDANRRPSTIADPNGDNYFRTSETCDLDPDEPAVQALERLLFELNGIDPAHGEPVQGQRYEPGQEFKQHTDYFEPNGVDFEKYCSVAGNRTWTFMAYLNDVDAGGATRFKVVGKTFQPEQGRLVGWNNHRPDGSLNAATLHHAMKVRKGLKYVITKWYRERPWGW
jgi:prolyl 4-hydroxylase